MAGGSYEVIEYNKLEREDCAGLRVILFSAFILHGINSLVTLINVCGLEMKLCCYDAICTLGVIEMIMIVWLQVGYFNAQESEAGCIGRAPFMYFWLMFQIMFLYVLMSFACCHFARKYCDDDVDDSDSDEEDFEKMEGETAGDTAAEGGSANVDADDCYENV